MKTLVKVILVCMTMSFAACSTVAGVGKDITGVADWTKEKWVVQNEKHPKCCFRLIALLAACGTTDPYAKRAEQERDLQVRTQERTLDKTPSWYNNVPVSSSAVYEAGFGSSFSMADADAYAKNDAYGKLCMTAGGKTSQMTKTYSSEGENSRTQINETCN